MASPSQTLLAGITRTVLALLPWAGALYLLYWLEQGGVWSVEMPFRALFSVLIIAAGMLLSFLLHTRLSRKAR